VAADADITIRNVSGNNARSLSMNYEISSLLEEAANDNRPTREEVGLVPNENKLDSNEAAAKRQRAIERFINTDSSKGKSPRGF